ncbi:MAG: transcription antitermination protein NusB [Muribaculaceae bacterium]|nr:transcription antitermination protein NusB [Muribaculaceae bacterium]
MINRVLIRIKVVQLLYSYFLVQNNFTVQSIPSAPTKEKRFAYSLYLDYLYLMIDIAESINLRTKNSPLYETRFIQRLLADNIIKSVSSKYSGGRFPLDACVDDLCERIKNSAIYKNFLKDPKSDSKIWPELFRHFISVDPKINSIAEGFENYSLRGVDRAKEMITQTFSEFASSQDNILDGLSDLKASLDKARELYFRLLMLPIDITYQREVDLDERRHRYLKSEDDLNPNPKFIDNELVKLLDANEEIKDFAQKNKVSWLEQDRDLIKHLLKKIIESDLYKDYMANPVSDLHEDCEFWKKAMRNIILNDQEFLEGLETMSVFWNDDLDIMGDFVLKTFRRFEDKASDPDSKIQEPVLPMYKDSEDAKFGKELFEATVKKHAVYRGYIDETLNKQHWDSDRLAYMDVVIMVTALAEIFNFPKIPIQASLNEYIEIAKSYSSSKSGSFINGLLAGVISNLKESGKLRK